MKTEEKLKKIAEILENKKAENLRIFKVLELTSLTDYFIVVNGTSTTHIKALADEVEVEMRKLGEESRFEGKASDWLLLDFGDIITHIFLPTAREKYNLEKLWSEAEEFDINKLHTI